MFEHLTNDILNFELSFNDPSESFRNTKLRTESFHTESS